MREDNPMGMKPFDAAEYLNDEQAISEYLNAAAEIGDPAVLLDAFAAVGRAKGMAELARKAGVGRESLYKALAPGAHPRYDTIFKVAQALGVGFQFSVSSSHATRKAVPSSAISKISARPPAKKGAVVKRDRRRSSVAKL